MCESSPNCPGAATEIDHRQRRVGEDTGEQVGDPGTAREPEPFEDIGVVRRRPFGIERSGLFDARDRPGTPDRIGSIGSGARPAVTTLLLLP
jgi:hypothetical protein